MPEKQPGGAGPSTRILEFLHPMCTENLILMIIMIQLPIRQIETPICGASRSALING
jgi:hypothetical protein